MAINKYLSLITLNVNGINTPIKRHRVVDGYRNKTATYAAYKKTHFKSKDTHRLKVRGWKKLFHAN